jgi:hypothetical protein
MYAECAFPVSTEEVASEDSIYSILWIVQQIANEKLTLFTRIAYGMRVLNHERWGEEGDVLVQ